MTDEQELHAFVSERRNRKTSASEKDSDLPVFSIVIPSLNQGAFIERTLLSVLNQDYPRLELVIVDGGSTDETLEIIRKYESFVATWISEPDQGQSHALNKGFSRATGEIYGWLNSDDIYLEGTLRQVARAFREHPDAGICYGDWFSIDDAEKIIDRTYALPPRVPRFPYENLKSYNQSLFWRRNVHERFGRFDEKLHLLMDNDMILNFLLHEGPGRFHRLERFLGAFRRHGRQKTDTGAVDAARLGEEEYLERKFGFASRRSFSGIGARLDYRAFQFRKGLERGGPGYVLRKLVRGVRMRRGVL